MDVLRPCGDGVSIGVVMLGSRGTIVMWGIASINFGSTYTKNDYLGKKVLSPVPHDVGCVCVVRCRWALLSLAALVRLAMACGTSVAGVVIFVGRIRADIPEQVGI